MVVKQIILSCLEGWKGQRLRYKLSETNSSVKINTAEVIIPKHPIILDLLHNRILNFTRVCVLIFLSLSCSLVLWYKLNEQLWDISWCLPIPESGKWKPTWRSRERWLAKLAWYDVPWKPIIVITRVFSSALKTTCGFNINT